MRRRKRAQAAVGGSTNAAAELIAPVAQSAGHGLAHVDSLGVIERVRFTDVACRAAEWAELVREQGVRPGDRVVVLSGGDREWRFALLGVIQAGGVAVTCAASTPDRELRVIADDAKAVLFVSAGPWPDLAVPGGARVVSSNDLERRHRVLAAEHVPHLAMPADVALITWEDGPDGLRGSRHTHASLLGAAAEAQQWLGLRAGERVWSTAADGSVESIWLLLGAWRAAAEIVAVDHAFELETELELLARFQPATVWFSDEEYAALAAVTASEWVERGSIRRAVTRGERADGAAAFEQAFGATVVPVEVSNESGVRLAGELPLELDGDSPTALDVAEPALLSALDEAVAVAAAADGAEKVDARTRRDEAKRRKQAERAAAEERRRVEAAERAEREAAAAEERKRVEDDKRRDEERAREEAKARKEAELAGVEERRRVQEAERKRAEEEDRSAAERKRETAEIRKLAEREAAKREAAAAAVPKRAEEEKPHQADLAREEMKSAKKERQRAEKAERAEREAAAAAERKRAEEEKRREEARAREEAKSRKQAEREAEKERQRAEKAERAEREAAAAAERKRAEEEKRRKTEREREEAKRRKKEPLRAAAKVRRRIEAERARKRDRDAADSEGLDPDILSSISQYGIGASSAEPGERPDGEAAAAPSAAATREKPRDVH
jgi:hypothetical protein